MSCFKISTIRYENSTLNSKSNRPKRRCRLLINNTNLKNHTNTDVRKKPANLKNSEKVNLSPSHPVLKPDVIPSVLVSNLPKNSTSKIPLLLKPCPINRPKRGSRLLKNVRNVSTDLPKNFTLDLKKRPSPKPPKLRRSKRSNKLLKNDTNIEDERKKQNTKNYSYVEKVTASHHVFNLSDSDSNLNPKKRPHPNPYLPNHHKNGNVADLPKNSTLNSKKPPSYQLRRSKRGNQLLENVTNIEDERKKQTTKNYTSIEDPVLNLPDSNLNLKKIPHPNLYPLNQHKSGRVLKNHTKLECRKKHIIPPKNSNVKGVEEVALPPSIPVLNLDSSLSAFHELSKKPILYQNEISFPNICPLNQPKTGSQLLLEKDSNIEDSIRQHIMIHTDNDTNNDNKKFIPEPSHPVSNSGAITSSFSELCENFTLNPKKRPHQPKIVLEKCKIVDNKKEHINTENDSNATEDKEIFLTQSDSVFKSPAISSAFPEYPKNFTLDLNEGQQSDICLPYQPKRAKKLLRIDTNIEDSRIKQINLENYTNDEAIVPSHPVMKQSSILSFFHEKPKNLNLQQNKCSFPNLCRPNKHKKVSSLLKNDINMENHTNHEDNIDKKMSIQETDNVKLPEFWTKLKFKEDPSCVAFAIWNTGEIEKSTSHLNHPDKLVRVKEKDNGQLRCTVHIGSVIVKQSELINSVLTLEKIIEEADKTTFNFEKVIIKQENSLDSVVTLQRIIEEAQKMTVHVGNEIIKQYESLDSVVTLERIEKTLAQCLP